jgi:hypothetical protein
VKRALLVGIDDYPGSPLGGCVADATVLADLLQRHYDGAPNYTVRLVTSASTALTRGALRELLKDLFQNSRGAELLLFFAGHGSQTPWGAELVTPDYSPNSLGVSMNDVLTLANDSPASEVTIILDCCFSGDLANIPGLQAIGLSEEFSPGRAILREGVTVLAASRATETSAESGGHGAFSRLLIDGLEGAAADHFGQVSAFSLYAFASQSFTAWEQRPVFKSHVTAVSPLRLAQPWIKPESLRELPTHFPTAAARYQMTPAHEGERPIPAGQEPTAEQKVFDYFKRLRNAGLLTSDNDKDLYFAAMDSSAVFLTALGRHFWELASEGKL